jgi:hypothetical protein
MTTRQTGPDPLRDNSPQQEMTLAEWKDIASSAALTSLAIRAGLLPDPSVQQEINAMRARAMQPRTLAPKLDPKPPTLE